MENVCQWNWISVSICFGEQVGVQEFFEGGQGWSIADLCWERVPKGGGNDTESSVPKSLHAGVGGSFWGRVQGWRRSDGYWGHGRIGEEKDFVGDVGLDREPVKVDEGGGDVLPALGGVRTLTAEFCT